MTLCRYFQLGSGYLTFFFITLGPTGYFMYNIKEFYMGEYYLPIVNPISEGSILGFVIVCLCAWAGWESIQQPALFGMPYTHLYAAFIIVTQVYQNAEMFVEVIRAKKYEMPFTILKYLKDCSSYLVLYLL